ncbi:hypothetical protein ACIBJC_31960 [Streptomyces sp. NPDC050509]|uniref:hypothetical protein n=1 Tax=Streptomyces sp. NPDC050509 TaxID=3365620 RepID=UPI00378A0E89
MLALVDGLGLQVLSQQYAEEDAVALLDAQLALLFGGRPSRNAALRGREAAADTGPRPGGSTKAS